MKQTYILTMTLFALIISSVSAACSPDNEPVNPRTEVPDPDSIQVLYQSLPRNQTLSPEAS